MKKLLTTRICLAVIALVSQTGSVRAQEGAISIARISCQFRHDTLQIPSVAMNFVFRYTNNTGKKVDISNGFKFFSPDGGTWDSTTVGFAGDPSFASYFDIAFAFMNAQPDGYGNMSVGLLAAGTQVDSARQLPAGYIGTPLVVTLWGVSTINDGRHLCVDTCFFQPGGTWVWVDNDLVNHYPTFNGAPGKQHPYPWPNAYCFYLFHPPCAEESETSDSAHNKNLNCSCSTCCYGSTGNVNLSGIVDLGDLSALVSYLIGGGYLLPCEAEANINSSGIVDLSDLSSLVNFLTGAGYTLPNYP